MTSRYVLPFIHKCHVTIRSLSVLLYIQSSNKAFLFREMWTGNIETMSLEMIIWPWIRDTLYEWLSITQSLCLRCLHTCRCVLLRISMIWRHDKVDWERTTHATSHHCFITTLWRYNILYQTGYFRKFQRKTWKQISLLK